MADSARAYTRLTRNTAGLGSYSSLWLGAEHLIVVRSTGYHENYARLELADIKAVFLVATNRRAWIGIAWGVLAFWGGAVLVATLLNRGMLITSPFFFGLGTIGLVWNHLLGEGCQAYVMTGVQTAELPPLVRLKKARRVLARMQPLIEAAQSHLTGPPPVAPAPAEPAPAAPSASAPATAEQPGTPGGAPPPA